MSAITEMANAEADAVEAELGPDEELEADGEEEQEPEPEAEPEGISERQLEQMFKTLDKETDRHTKRVQDITGESFADLLPCPRCHPSIPGYCAPIPPEGLDPEQIMAVDLSLGRDAVPSLKQPEWAVSCETCDGYGVIATGAKAEHSRAVTCKRCNGAGWFDREEGQLVTPAAPALTLAPAPGETIVPNQPPFDQWGRPAGHERFGIDIQYTGGTW